MFRAMVTGMSAAAAFSLCIAVANASDAPPKGNTGFSTSKTETVDLGPEINGMKGRQLRLRILHIEPGGHTGIHSHKDRPSVVYFLQGVDTVSFADGTKKTFHPGDVTSATAKTTHWHQNEGNVPVVLIAVDVFHKTK